MMSSIFLYIYLTFIPVEEELIKVIEVNLPMESMEVCETAKLDLQINVDAMFDIDREAVHIEAECVDFSEWLDFEEKIDINSVGG